MRARPVLAALLLGPALAAARADAPPEPSGIVLGARFGYGQPFGDLDAGGRRVDTLVAHKLPIWLEVGYRFNPFARAQLHLELAPATAAAGTCTAGVSCPASDVRIGLGVQLHLAPRRLVDPWIGVGAGVEVMNARVHDAASGTDFNWSWAGIELPSVEGGLDFVVSSRFTIGPYANVSFARFTSVSSQPVGGTTTSGKLQSWATHGWVQGGIKLTLLL